MKLSGSRLPVNVFRDHSIFMQESKEARHPLVVSLDYGFINNFVVVNILNRPTGLSTAEDEDSEPALKPQVPLCRNADFAC